MILLMMTLTMAKPIRFLEQSWFPIHDTVMGGRSTGTVAIEKKRLIFSGNLSLENNGGFASIRSSYRGSDLESVEGIRLQVIGDGRNYLATIRRNSDQRMISHRAKFSTQEGQVEEILIPFAKYKWV